MAVRLKLPKTFMAKVDLAVGSYWLEYELPTELSDSFNTRLPAKVQYKDNVYDPVDGQTLRTWTVSLKLQGEDLASLNKMLAFIAKVNKAVTIQINLPVGFEALGFLFDGESFQYVHVFHKKISKKETSFKGRGDLYAPFEPPYAKFEIQPLWSNIQNF